MNSWGFWAAVIQSVAWPATISFSVWLLRKEIRKLLPYAQLKVGGYELSIRTEMQAVLDQARLSEVTNDLEEAQIDKDATRNLDGLSDEELRAEVSKYGIDLRRMAFDFRLETSHAVRIDPNVVRINPNEDFHAVTQDLLEKHEKQRLKFQSSLYPMVRALHQELLRRLKERGIAFEERSTWNFVFETGSLAGPDPLGGAASRLEDLSRLLK